MNPDDLIIDDYSYSLHKSPESIIANPPIDSNSSDLNTDDPIIKLNQAWEKEVKDREDMINIMVLLDGELGKYKKIGSVIPSFISTKAKSFVRKADIQPLQTSHKV